MRQRISVLIVDTSEEDIAEILREFKKAGFEVYHRTAETIEEFRNLIDVRPWDIVLSEHSTPDFDNFEAINIIEELQLDLTYILLGRGTPEEYIVKALHEGIHDHVEKSRLHRLVPIVKRELKHILLKRRHRRSKEQNKLLSHILTKSLNEIYLVDPETMEFNYANDAILNNLGYSKDEFYWLTPYDIVAESEIEKLKTKYQGLIEGSTDRLVIEKWRKRKDGSTYPVEVHLEMIEQGTSHFILGICFDISQRIKDAEELERRKKESRKLALENKYKSEFIATISHEMKTSLNSVIMLSEILGRNSGENLTNEQIDHLDLIQSSNTGLLEMLNEVLDMSKVGSGKVEVRLEKFELLPFCKRLERLYQPIAREKGIRFDCEIADDVPDTINSDRIRLEQILKNLISNAMKFTPEGGISVEVSTASNKEILFKVTDTGIGIPLDAQDRIFMSYEQAEGEDTTKKYGGTGLGLSISKQISQLLGGRIEVESTPGEGSTFSVYVPVDSESAVEAKVKKGEAQKISSKPVAADTPKSPVSEKTGTVLLVDDSSIHNMALKEFLGFKIETCITAETASEAYKVLDSQQVDCIVLDMYLPDADGKDVLKTLKSSPKHKDIPVIIYSGKNLGSDEEQEILEYASEIVHKNVKSYKVLLQSIMDQMSTKPVEN